MVKNHAYTITAQRLHKYRQFSSETIKVVANVAENQATYATYQEYFKSRGVGTPFLHALTKKEAVPVVDIPATQKPKPGKTEPAEKVLVLHLPMANPLDPNQLFQAATIAAVNPEYRVIAFGNPSGKPYHYREQNLHWRKRLAIAHGANKRALVAAELDYLTHNNIKQTIHAGYSYGAHKALVSALYSQKGSVKQLILVDPVAHSRSVKQLAQDFQRTLGPLDTYTERTESKIFLQARRESAQQGPSYKQYIRPINIAIAFMLARLDFSKLLQKVLTQSDTTFAAVAWGVKSELGNDAHMDTMLQDLAKTTGRIRTFRLEDDVHALANDIYLHAALIREALN